jgi:hypothetical protein
VPQPFAYFAKEWEKASLNSANERFTGILRLTHLGFFSVGCLSRQPREEAQTHDFSLYEKMF